LDQRIRGSEGKGTTGSEVQWFMGFWFRGSEDQGIKGSEEQRIRGSEEKGTTG
jgi:hypothetical protein